MPADISARASIELLTLDHDLRRFHSGEPSLDSWVQNSELRNQRSGDSRTYVAMLDGEVAGFYALCAASVRRADLTGDLRRNAPDPVPLMLIAQLAVGTPHQGRNLGKLLLSNALNRLAILSEQVGFRAVVTHPINDTVHAFYSRFGFKLMPDARPSLMALPLAKLLAALAG